MTLGIWITTFAAGIIFGAVMLLFYASKMGRAQPSQTRPNSHDAHKSLKNRLEVARKRFGQIANRESINEARKLANQALKELT